MRRRQLLGGFVAAVVLQPLKTFAQATAKRRPLIALLATGSVKSASPYESSFLQGMNELGYVEGRDFDIADRYAEGDLTLLPALAAQLVRLNPDVIVATATAAAIAVKQQTVSIPIVASATADPTALGLTANQARPGGNVTGILGSLDSLFGKQLELGLELVPGAEKAGMLVNLTNPASGVLRRGAESAAAMKAIQLVPAEVRAAADIDAALKKLARERVGIVLVQADPMFIYERRRIATLAVQAMLPVVYPVREHVEEGGLISYGINLRQNFRRAATYVDKLLKGAKPGDLPVQQPTKFELVINMKTAKALGIDVPLHLQQFADEVIE
jgi:putative tryptophan/tyrosine transport system substrate-binding protein